MDGMVTDNDRGRIKHFVSNVWHWVRACHVGDGSVANQLDWPLIQIEKRYLDIAVTAWHEFERDLPLDRLLTTIDAAPDENLRSHGLYGAQLQYKLELVSVWARKGHTKRRGWRKRFIEIVDNLLDSIVAATGAGGALKELKDSLMGSLQ